MHLLLDMDLQHLIGQAASALLSSDVVTAKSSYEQALQCPHLPPDVATAVAHNLALCLEMQQDYGAAFDAYLSNANDPHVPLQTKVRSMIGMANTLRHRGCAHRSMDMLKDVTLLAPQHAQTYFLLSAGHVRRNNIEEACRALCVGLASVHDTAARETRHYAQCYYEPMSSSVYYSKSGCATNLDLLYCECFRETDILEFHKAPLPPLPIRSITAGSSFPRTGDQPSVVYVSEHFHKGSVMSNILPILESHSFSFAVINLGSARDAVSERVDKLASLVFKFGEEDESKHTQLPMFRVAVCCDGHTGSKKALRFLQDNKVAGTVLDCIGYPFSTGNQAVHHKLVDSLTDPPGAEAAYTESLARLDPCFLTWRPLLDADDPSCRVSAYRPCTEHRVLAPNNFKKMGRTCTHLYKCLLKRDPVLQLYFKSASHDAGTTQAYFQETFSEFADRVHVLDAPDSTEDHYNLTATFDLVVDAYPYNGTITTLEALWCGVPVVSVAGNTHRSRVGKSILSCIGRQDLVVEGPDSEKFCDAAMSVLKDNRSTDAHADVLHCLQQSPIMRHRAYTERFEDILMHLE